MCITLESGNHCLLIWYGQFLHLLNYQSAGVYWQKNYSLTSWFYNKIKSARLSNDWFKTKQQQVRVDVHLQLAFDKQHLQQLYDDRWRNAKCEVQTSCHLGGMRILNDHFHFTAKSFKKQKIFFCLTLSADLNKSPNNTHVACKLWVLYCDASVLCCEVL